MMDAVDEFELAHHGVYPIAFDRRWHCGMHLAPSEQTEPVRAIADGDVVAYRVSQKAISDGQLDRNGNPALNSNNGFVLLKHKTDTGEGRTITFYSLYMHLLDINAQQIIAPQPTTPPVTGSASALPAWLLQPTDGVRVGGNKKVYRKDILGYWGQCHGQPHLHFEIFMTEADFSDYFGHTQLGNTTPTTPRSTDFWGHSYFVIPAGHAFVSVPPGQTGSPYFPALKDGTLDVHSKLYVEAYFHKGKRYTNSWVEQAGTPTLLTAEPIPEPEYEYTLYQRATALYPQCPSDGYDLIRFGRILSTQQPTLPVAARKNWLAVTYDASGARGYINVSEDSIQKLSDSDFPFFMGWRRIDEANTPFSQDGLCDYDELRDIVEGVEAAETVEQRKEPAYKQEDRLTAYVQGDERVRNRLKRFVCHAPSEWDKNGNDARYTRLNDPDGFFGKRKDFDPRGYEEFIDFLGKFQFLEQTPLGGGRKYWFFHPLAFVRHFRKCGWLSARELAQCIPRRILDQTRSQAQQTVYPTGSVAWNSALNRAQRLLIPLNQAFRKYRISADGIRLSYFLGNAIQETTYLTKTAETGGPTLPYAPWYGRGIIQLTHEENYKRYGDYRGWFGTTPASYRDSLETDPARAADSAGFYWVCCAKPKGREHNIHVEADDHPIITQTTVSNVCSDYDYRTRVCKVSTTTMGFRACQQFERAARAVNTGSPNGSGVMYGLVPRTNVFLSSMAKLSDVLIDFEDAYAQKES
ncbi:M23 family metallopeptidase [Cupriavidus pinatubonensis]|uniref:M23 family metallopeptidase n=1 Tax=Cupriavidus pinatubonensis TaxID=248026 RepID=UPI001FD040B3|nr:M23 family metallopeptidase [Cupriavidus pinatubonensis]